MKNTIAKIRLFLNGFWSKNKSRLFEAIKRTIISFAVLVVLIVITGVIYTWYTGNQQSDVTSQVFTQDSETTKAVSDIQNDPNANVGVSVQYISSPILPGSEATITIKTNREAECTIDVKYNKIPSKDASLIRQIADEYGVIKWDWFVEDDTPIGTWPVGVNCYKNEKSGFVRGDLKVVNSLE